MPLILASAQIRVKDTVASSPTVGLAVRANGEEKTTIIDRKGNVITAEIPQPTTAPVLANQLGGNLTLNRWYAYRYVYASSKNYPLVENEFSINGALYPRGNPSPVASIKTPNSGTNREVGVTVAYSARLDIDEVWIFRTVGYTTKAEADNAAEAGLAYYHGKIPNIPAGTTGLFTDEKVEQGVDLVELDNYPAPTFQFCIFYDPYWLGFGNFTFRAAVTWDNNGLVTLQSGKWFDGRNGQFMTLSGITTGGFDSVGGWRFKWVSDTTAYATLDGEDTLDPGSFPAMGEGPQMITIQGPSTTIYRSKYRNPFSWGWTRVVGSLKESKLWALKVGGGLGTAIAVVPNEPILKVDCEYPAKCFAFNLQLLDNLDSFRKTRRIVSDTFSITSHWSQFPAMTQNGISVLWGIDYKNFAILQSNGISQVPVAGPIPKILRRLTTNRSRQLLSHGVYDPYTELNCLWVTTQNSVSLVNYLIFQHAPTGFWGFMDERDVLCSASIPDGLTGQIRTMVGTETGIYGQAFYPGMNANWLPTSGTYTGVMMSATANTITIESGAFNTVDDGIVGNWCLVTDANDEKEQWARISGVTEKTLTFDIVASANGNTLLGFSPLPVGGSKFYIGLIECRLQKMFDLQLPATDKRFMELWMTQQNVQPLVSETIVRLYREREERDYAKQFYLEQHSYDDGQKSDVWFQKQEIPSELLKSFTVEFINRGYLEWRMYNYMMKVQAAP